MLVLSRRSGQSILIGKDIEVIVLGTDGVQVRLGFRAPHEVVIVRRELLREHVNHTDVRSDCPLCYVPDLDAREEKGELTIGVSTTDK